MVPLDPALPRAYIERITDRPFNRAHVDFYVAARAFHTNKFEFGPSHWSRWRAMEHDYDKIPPEQVEEELTAQDWEKIEKQEDDFNPRSPRRRNAKRYLT
jgi:hypothetical protein